MSEPLDAVRIEPAGAAGSVIWLHGLGADGHDFEPIVPLLELAVPLRFVFPHAPLRPVTLNGGMTMRAWYDIDLSNPTVGSEDIRTSVTQVGDLLAAEEAAGVPRERIVLAGFSQGGVIAMELGLGLASRPAGLMALSTYLHDHEHAAERISFAAVDLPVFMAHGRYDPMIPIARAVTARETLTRLNVQVEWHEYEMGHEVCHEEIRAMGRWLNGIYGPAGA